MSAGDNAFGQRKFQTTRGRNLIARTAALVQVTGCAGRAVQRRSGPNHSRTTAAV